MNLIVDIERQAFLSEITGSASASLPAVFRGDIHELTLSLLEGGVPVDPAGKTVRVGIGLGSDKVPVEGSFWVGYEGDPTAYLPFTGGAFPAPGAVATAFNAIPAIIAAGGVTVTAPAPGSYRFDFVENGERSAISKSGFFLPAGIISSSIIRAGDANSNSVQLIRIATAPIALATDFVQSTPAASFELTAPGIYTLKLPKTTLTASIFWSSASVFGPGASSLDVERSLAYAEIDAKASAVDDNTWLIFGTDIASPTILLTAVDVLTSELRLDTDALATALGTASSLTAIIEVEVTSVTNRVTAVQKAVTINRTILEDPTIPVGADAALYMLRTDYDSDGDGVVDATHSILGPAGPITGAALKESLDTLAGMDVRLTTLEDADAGEGNAKTANNLSDLADKPAALANLSGASLSYVDAAFMGFGGMIEAIEGAAVTLTGRVTTAEGAITTNTAAIATNTAGLAGAVAAAVTLDGRVTTAEGAITTNTAAISTNATDIDTLETRASAIETAATDLTGRVTTAEAGITTNAAAIATNGTAIAAILTDAATLNGRVITAEGAITTNTAAIAAADTAIAARLVAANNLSDVANAVTARANIGAYPAASVVSTNTPGTAVLRGVAGAIVVGTIASTSITVTGSITASSGITALGIITTTGNSTFGTGILTINSSVTNIGAGALTVFDGVVSIGQGALIIDGVAGSVTLSAGAGLVINGGVVFGTGSSLQFTSSVAASTITGLTAGVTGDKAAAAITLTDADSGKVIRCTAATGITITAPAGLLAGFNVLIIQGGAGQITFIGAGLQSYLGLLKTAGQYAAASIIRVAADTYNLSGNLTA